MLKPIKYIAFKTTLALAKGNKMKRKKVTKEILNTFDSNNKL
jgi:hypothetical protein